MLGRLVADGSDFVAAGAAGFTKGAPSGDDSTGSGMNELSNQQMAHRQDLTRAVAGHSTPCCGCD
jgi:hypothetical protein